MKTDYLRILSQSEIDGLFCLDETTLANMLDEMIKELGYNPCVFNHGKEGFLYFGLFDDDDFDDCDM